MPALAAALVLPTAARGASAPRYFTAPSGTHGGTTVLPSGRLISPAGSVTRLGDFPVAEAVVPGADLLVVANSGQGEGSNPSQGDESLQVVDLRTRRVVQTITDHEPGASTFYNGGISVAGRHVFVTGGGNDQVYDYVVGKNRRLTRTHEWTTTRRHGTPTVGLHTRAEGIPASAPLLGDFVGYPRGVAATANGARLVVTNEQGSSVAAIDTASGVIAWETQIGGLSEASAYPGSVVLSPNGATAFVTAQGTGALITLDVATGAVRSSFPVGDHPVAIARTGDGKYVAVANANDDTVNVVDVSGVAPVSVKRLSTHLVVGEANGTTPDAVAFDDARHVLYVANAGDDTVAIIGSSQPAVGWDPGTFAVRGFIPTAWYPTAVAVGPDGAVLAASAKGYGGVPVTNSHEYDGNDMVGTLQRVAPPDRSTLAAFSAQARHDLTFANESADAARPADSPIPDAAHPGSGPIKHVVMVVRENRTFDQVFGDLPAEGWKGVDADPRYLEFGETNRAGKTVTPNAHRLARAYGISDNFYSDGEASIQGHHWTAEGISSDYTEKSWVHYYSSRNHAYDPTAPVVYPRCGSVFQQLAAAGISFKDYGELVGVSTAQPPTSGGPGTACPTEGGAHDPQVAASTDSAYPNNLLLTSVKDTDRLTEFKKSYAAYETSGAVPAFTYLLMGNDHTDGADPGKPTPEAHVATNDAAVGGLIDYLSHTKDWASTVVFVQEDDSQDGLDHRDGHRNILIAAGPNVRPHIVSHVHTSQASVLHTVERILGLPSLTAYTQLAPIPYDLFQATPNLAPYTAITPTYDMGAVNGKAQTGTAAAVPVDTSKVDVAGPVLEAQLWQAVHPGAALPRALAAELGRRGGITPQALAAWSTGHACLCPLLQPGLTTALGAGRDADG
ncbi:MAG: alkaline phosphatase family protein [Acidimicrobiales bacterium]